MNAGWCEILDAPCDGESNWCGAFSKIRKQSNSSCKLWKPKYEDKKDGGRILND